MESDQDQGRGSYDDIHHHAIEYESPEGHRRGARRDFISTMTSDMSHHNVVGTLWKQIIPCYQRRSVFPYYLPPLDPNLQLVHLLHLPQPLSCLYC